MDTLLLDTRAWDLVLDANGKIAVASAPYSLAQDAASAIRTFLGECYYDTTKGIDYLSLFGKNVPLALLKAKLAAVAAAIPDVSGARVFFTALNHRTLSGQVQVTQQSTGTVAAASFAVVNPQGGG